MITQSFLIECRRANGNFNLYWTGKQYIGNPVHGKRYTTARGASIAMAKIRKPNMYEMPMQAGDCLCVTPVKLC